MDTIMDGSEAHASSADGAREIDGGTWDPEMIGDRWAAPAGQGVWDQEVREEEWTEAPEGLVDLMDAEDKNSSH